MEKQKTGSKRKMQQLVFQWKSHLGDVGEEGVYLGNLARGMIGRSPIARTSGRVGGRPGGWSGKFRSTGIKCGFHMDKYFGKRFLW